MGRNKQRLEFPFRFSVSVSRLLEFSCSPPPLVKLCELQDSFSFEDINLRRCDFSEMASRATSPSVVVVLEGKTILRMHFAIIVAVCRLCKRGELRNSKSRDLGDHSAKTQSGDGRRARASCETCAVQCNSSSTPIAEVQTKPASDRTSSLKH